MYNLGICYVEGNGTAKNCDEAFKCFKKAADNGDDAAQYNLAVCYANGWGVARDDAKALKLFRASADAGNEDAKAALAELKSR